MDVEALERTLGAAPVKLVVVTSNFQNPTGGTLPLAARREVVGVTLIGTTIPHEITIKYGGSRILLKPASPGTGVIAGGGVRAVLEAAGVRDILTKSLGSSNQLNMIRATLIGLETMKNPETLATAIRIGDPVSWPKALNEVTVSRGAVTKVSEQEIADA